MRQIRNQECSIFRFHCLSTRDESTATKFTILPEQNDLTLADLCSFFCHEKVQRGIKWNIYQMRPDLFHSGIITRNDRGSNQDEKVSLLTTMALDLPIHGILWTLQVSITKMMRFECFIDLISFGLRDIFIHRDII